MSAKKKEQPSATSSESIQFSAEISKVLKLMIHSLYTNKDIFLRELISNASDACDKLRYAALKDDALRAADSELKIEIGFNAKARTISISDNGIGMNREDLIANLGTIARSGTEEFLAQLSGDNKQDVALIGQFGVGFYSSYMVASDVVVESQKAGETNAWRWESDGNGSFTIAEALPFGCGTRITLHLQPDAKEYLDKFKLEFIVQTYSDHISFPIELIDEEGTVTRINEASAIWTRPKSDITPEQYKEFYAHVAHQPDEPFLTLHNKAEGTMEYTSLLFVPSMKPFDLFHPERRRRVKLYVKRVFITDENVDLIPAYLRFLRGVVDSQDLPLNISRETLQDNPMLAKIRDSITKKLLSELIKKAEKDPESYLGFWENFGAVLKEGLCEISAPKDKILQACRFASTHSEDGLVSLKDYVERMKDGQEWIYVIHGDQLDSLRHSAQLEGFRKHGIEVLLLTDHVDDFWLNVNAEFEGKRFKSVTKAGDDLDAFASDSTSGADAEQTDESKQSSQKEQESVAALIERMQTVYGERVRQVRTTGKLSESPVCLAVGEGDMDLRMERFLREHKQLPSAAPKILEINPEHPIIHTMMDRLADPASADYLRDLCWLLLDQANIQEGEPIADPSAFSRRLSQFLIMANK